MLVFLRALAVPPPTVLRVPPEHTDIELWVIIAFVVPTCIRNKNERYFYFLQFRGLVAEYFTDYVLIILFSPSCLLKPSARWGK